MHTTKKIQIPETVKITKEKKTPVSLNDHREHLRVLLEAVIRELVSHPEDISVSYHCGERTTVYTVDCSQRVLGYIIGSRGKHIQSIRNLSNGISSRKGFRSIVEIPYFKPEITSIDD